MPFTDPDLGNQVKIYDKDENGLAFFGTSVGTPPTTASEFAPGALFVDLDNKLLYMNTGTSASPSWNSVHEIATGDIADGAISAAKVLDTESVTATADGLTTGLISALTSLKTFVTVTSADANHIVTLPAASSANIGAELYLTVTSNGYEIRTPASSNNTINLVDADGGANELAVAANTTVRLTQVSATGWIAETIAATTITVSAPDAVA